MKTINYILGILAASATMTACVGDLNVTPIDPNANTVDKVLTSQAALDSYISGVYLGFATSGYYGPNGGASIFTFDIKGGQAEAHAFIDALEIFSLLANVADVKSLVIHPASTTHSQLSEEELLAGGIKPTTIRLSIGTEHIDDILADLQLGFEAVRE